jgi:hypothetical protein
VADSAAPEDTTAWEDTTQEAGDSDSPAPEDSLSLDSNEDCDCHETMWCSASGCVLDVCSQGETTCHDLHTLRMCEVDGSDFLTTPCPAEDVCYLGQCLTPICQPGDPPVCDGITLMMCNSLGLEYVPIPCPGGTGCVDGSCQAIEPNVLLIVDTSGSMSLLADTADQYPSDCVGADCPVWDFPNCDDPAKPQTRIARVKVAIQQFLGSEAAQSVRLAMMRFPQTGHDFPVCKSGYYGHQFFLSGDEHLHFLELGWFTTQLHEILCVGFSETPASNLFELAQWIDFKESIESTGQGCEAFFDCDFSLCMSGSCWTHTDPELRGTGPTPLGKSLFYAGEYLRHFVLNEGKACSIDADCQSPHYTCVSGTCRDPFFDCRPTSIILFTDGIETVFETSDDFFNPRVQAKRLHYGLACESAAECLNGADCVEGVCRFQGEDLIIEKQCNAFAMGCESDADCPDFLCGLPELCEGLCQSATVNLVDAEGANHLASAEGNPLPITTHVIDASGWTGANKLIATYGGGQHVPVNLADIDNLALELVGLLDTKLNAAPCAE